MKITVRAKETVEKSVVLEVGKDISEKHAERLMAIQSDEISLESDDYLFIDSLLGLDVMDSSGFFDVQIHNETEKQRPVSAQKQSI